MSKGGLAFLNKKSWHTATVAVRNIHIHTHTHTHIHTYIHTTTHTCAIHTADKLPLHHHYISLISYIHQYIGTLLTTKLNLYLYLCVWMYVCVLYLCVCVCYVCVCVICVLECRTRMESGTTTRCRAEEACRTAQRDRRAATNRGFKKTARRGWSYHVSISSEHNTHHTIT